MQVRYQAALRPEIDGVTGRDKSRMLIDGGRFSKTICVARHHRRCPLAPLASGPDETSPHAAP
jgi:hypothetical protein